MNRLRYYFLDLGFNGPVTYGDVTYGSRLAVYRVLLIYGFFSLGIFARQVTRFPLVEFNPAKIQLSVLAVSFIFGLALLPPVMRYFNKSHKKFSYNVVYSFSIGFFVDLASVTVIGLLPTIAQGL
jgi:hypothetical protein